MKCLDCISVGLDKGHGHQRFAMETRILVPLERKDDALVCFHVANDTAKSRKTVLLRGHGAAPRSIRCQLPIKFNRSELLGSQPSKHVAAALPKSKHERDRRVELTLDQQFIHANLIHCFRPFLGGLVSSVRSAPIRSKLPDQNLRYLSSHPSTCFSGSSSSLHGRHCACRPRVIRPARSNTFRCREIEGSDMSNGSASSFTVASP